MLIPRATKSNIQLSNKHYLGFHFFRIFQNMFVTWHLHLLKEREQYNANVYQIECKSMRYNFLYDDHLVLLGMLYFKMFKLQVRSS